MTASKHPNHKTRICEFFVKGMCLKGDRCSYAHGECELQKAPIRSTNLPRRDSGTLPRKQSVWDFIDDQDVFCQATEQTCCSESSEIFAPPTSTAIQPPQASIILDVSAMELQEFVPFVQATMVAGATATNRGTVFVIKTMNGWDSSLLADVLKRCGIYSTVMEDTVTVEFPAR